MKILHVVPTYFPATRYGGPIYSVHSLCKALAARGHETHVCTTNVDGPGVSDVELNIPYERDGVQVRYFETGTGRRLYRAPAMRIALEQAIQSFDLLHLHSVFLWPTAMAAQVAWRAGVPYVIAPRGMLVDALIRQKSRLVKRAWIKLIERRNLAHAAAVHVTSDVEETEIRKLGLTARRIINVGNGFDAVQIPRPRPQSRSRKPSQFPTVVFLGRLHNDKGIDLLIEAMVQVPGARLLIAGGDDDGCRARLEEVARRCGVYERTRFCGSVHGEIKWQLLASADVVVLASRSESFGNAALEAMACGVPVIVSAGVGLATTIAEVGAGLVVERTPPAIGAALTKLLGSPDERARMGNAGHHVAVTRFSSDAVAAQMERHYEDILCRR